MLQIERNISAGSYSPKGEEKELYQALIDRFTQLETFKSSEGVESKWTVADTMYNPHEISDSKLEEWQSKCSMPIVLEQTQTALSIFLERNPEALITASSEQYKNKELFFKELLKYNSKVSRWNFTKHKFFLNLVKYGWSVGRTYIKDINGWEEPCAEMLNPRDVFIDDMAKPLDDKSIRDWYWRRIYQYEDFKKEYPIKEHPNVKYLTTGGDTTEKGDRSQKTTENLVEVKFYENQADNIFAIMANEVLIYHGELPYKHKRISLWQAPFLLRNTETIYGIGLAEMLFPFQNVIDKLTNMAINELVLRIQKIILYSGSNNRDTDFFKMTPGIAHNIPDTDKIYEVGGNVGNAVGESMKMLEHIRELMEKASGISKMLQGDVLGKSATEAAINQESGMRRMRVPLECIKFAFEIEGNIRLDLIQEYYAKPKIEKVLSEKEIGQYLAEIEKNPSKFSANEDGSINVPKNRNVPMNIEQKKPGMFKKIGNAVTGKPNVTQYQESEQTNFFEITDEEIKFEGELEINIENVLLPSKSLEREQLKEMFQIFAQLPVTDLMKLSRKVVRDVYGIDPDDVLVDQDTMDMEAQKAEVQKKAQGDIMATQARMEQLSGMQQPKAKK